MEKLSFRKRLDRILDRITSDELLSNTGLGNEIGFHIFDYPSEYELEVRDHIRFILQQLPKKKPDLKFIHINLFELIVNYLRERRLLDKALEIQRQKGGEELLKKLKGPLSAEKIANAFVKAARPHAHGLVLVSGVGSSYPLLRSHRLLNNLHTSMKETPLVMFYPGVYTGQGLRLFGRLGEANYYRAFQLVV